ncbi:MAG: biopolymer transporter ExbD [Verrucomicrobia bacterium]|nr:biopolymer transporter ExbD [Verrucomicrobiota bacterium]
MKFKRHLEIVKGRIDAVPLVNVALLVLMFFLLGSAFVLQPGVNVNMLSLPLSTINVGSPAQGALMITVTRDDLIFFSDERTDLAKLKDGLEKSAQRFPGIRLVVKADQRVSYERLVQILDLVKAAGIQHVLLATRPLLNQPATPPIKPLAPTGQRP